MKSIAGSILIILMTLVAAALPAQAQDANQITAISPDSADPGTTGLLVIFTLDSDLPPPPPAGVLPDSVSLGNLGGTSIDHPTQYTVTAVFDIPADEPAGTRNATVIFTTPHGTLTFSMTAGFTINSAPDTPPTVTGQPTSQTVHVGDPASFTVTASGSPTLEYQWQKDEVDVAGATSSTLTFASVTVGDGGAYRCVVTNDHGSDTSEAAVLTVDTSVPAMTAPYAVVDTGQTVCYDDTTDITCPDTDDPFYGQDSQCDGYRARYAFGAGGLTVDDLTTGLTWQQTADTDEDGEIDAADKLTWAQAQAYPASLNAAGYGGYTDWRLPTIKELYSLMDFRGTDPSGYEGTDTSSLIPFLDTSYFDFGYGDTAAGERLIDAQYASSTLYVSTTGPNDDATLFGVNFADGRIKGYGLVLAGQDKTFYVMAVRGNTGYGINDFVDNSDGTVTDQASGLIWQQADSSLALDWEEALEYCDDLTVAGYTDWRLPNVKELQSVVDYTRSPDTTGSAAIDPLFGITSITNEAGQLDYPCSWAASTHATWNGSGGWGTYVCFGRAMGYMESAWWDVHGAGAQRSDPKSGDPSDWPTGHGPQGDAIRIYSQARCVRGANGPLYGGFSYLPAEPTDTTPLTFTANASGGTSPFTFTWDLGGSPDSGATVVRTLPAGVHSVTLTIDDAGPMQTVYTEQVTVTASSIPPVADGRLAGEAALFAPNAGDPDLIDVTYDASTCSGSKAVILYGNLGDFSGYAGSAQDDAGGGGTAQIDSAGLENVWFTIVWTSGDTAGHPGYAFDGLTEPARTWSAAGFAGLTGDDQSDGVCD